MTNGSPALIGSDGETSIESISQPMPPLSHRIPMRRRGESSPEGEAVTAPLARRTARTARSLREHGRGAPVRNAGGDVARDSQGEYPTIASFEYTEEFVDHARAQASGRTGGVPRATQRPASHGMLRAGSSAPHRTASGSVVARSASSRRLLGCSMRRATLRSTGLLGTVGEAGRRSRASLRIRRRRAAVHDRDGSGRRRADASPACRTATGVSATTPSPARLRRTFFVTSQLFLPS